MNNLNFAYALAFDTAGDLYFGQQDSVSMVPNQNGSLNPNAATVLWNGPLIPTGIALDNQGNVYAVDRDPYDRVWELEQIQRQTPQALNFGTATAGISSGSCPTARAPGHIRQFQIAPS